jgi:hypothetical protein
MLAGADPTPTPSPYPQYTGDPNLVTPGVIGFLAIAFIAILTVLLLVDMTRRVRRVRYRAEINDKLDAEERGESKPATAPED